MFNIFKFLILFVSIVILLGCSSKIDNLSNGHIKVFEDEDILILNALHHEELKNYKDSSKLFFELYNKSDKEEYLYRSLQNDISAEKYEDVISRVDILSKDNIVTNELIRFKVFSLVKLDKLDEATKLALSLVESTKSINDYILVSDIYVKHKKFSTALKYLESAYVKDYNEKILDRMSIVLYVNLQRKKDAIAQLETHSRVHGCSELICDRLIGFYSNDNNINGLLSTYLRIYKINSNKKIAKKIVQIYSYKKEYLKMIDFLEESSSDDELLFQLYVQFKNYKKAADIAYKLFKDSGDIKYLGQNAIFEYESSDDKTSIEMLSSVVEKLKEVINIDRDSVYLNYLGYILIDHDLDVEEGIGYIKEALLSDSNSAYYLDSLAWGYYKIGKCEEAKEIINRVSKMKGGDNEEVIKHLNIIRKCKNTKIGKK